VSEQGGGEQGVVRGRCGQNGPGASHVVRGPRESCTPVSGFPGDFRAPAS
jgi:hypothetical protein